METTVLTVFGFVAGLIVLILLSKFLAWPFKILLRLLLNSIIGGLALLLINFFGHFIGIYIGVNIVTALVAGCLGIPGIVLLLILQIIF